MDVTSPILEVEEDDDILDGDEPPQKKCSRRCGVSAEAIQEDELGDYVKKVLNVLL